MARIFVLDDDENRHQWFKNRAHGHDLTQAFNYFEAVELLGRSERFDQVFLDHDLCIFNDQSFVRHPLDPSNPEGKIIREMTGYDVCLFIAELPLSKHPHQLIVHSQNEPAAARMMAVLRDAGFSPTRWRFNPRDLSRIDKP